MTCEIADRRWEDKCFWISHPWGHAWPCLSCQRGAALMVSGITQTTSYHRDVLYWREPEIQAHADRHDLGRLLKQCSLFRFLSLMVWFALMYWLDKVSTAVAAGYRRSWLCQTYAYVLLYSSSPCFSFLFPVSGPVWRVEIHSLLAGSWYDSQLSFQRICAGRVFARVLAWKQEASGCFVVVGSSSAIPTEISVTWILDSGKANKRGFHMKSPELVATVPSHFLYTLFPAEIDHILPYLTQPIFSWLFAEMQIITSNEQTYSTHWGFFLRQNITHSQGTHFLLNQDNAPGTTTHGCH